MQKFRFNVKPTSLMGYSDVAHVRDDEDPLEAILQQAIENLSTTIDITIGGVTMFLAAWQDTDHWASDWVEKLGVDYDDVPDAVEALIVSEQENG